MKKPTALKLNGKPLDLNPPRPALLKIAAFLDRLPDTELLGATELVTQSGLGPGSVWDFCKATQFKAYSHKPAKSAYFGNPRAIVALKQFLAESGK